MSELFQQAWFLELTGDAQRVAWYNKLTQVKPHFSVVIYVTILVPLVSNRVVELQN